MVLSLLVDIDLSSVTASPALGRLEIGNSDTEREKSCDLSGQEISTEENKASSREIRISITSPDDIYRQLWQATQIHPVLNVVELKVLPNEIASKTGRAWVRRGGKLSYDCKWSQEKGVRKCEPRTLLNSPRQASNNKRRIFHGFHEYDIDVAIEKIEMRDDLIIEIEREFRILRELDIHENFIRYFSFETDERTDFVYIATELCLCSVADLFQQNSSEDDKSKAAEILSSLSAKGILFQATRGLDYLHQNHFVHRNVKPSSFLIKEIQSSNSSNRYAVKITDFRLSRQLDQGKDLSGTVASEGWEAPESRREKQPLHQSLDVFILGCFYHYVLTGTVDGVDSSPTHPFGNTEMARLVNIPNTKNEVYQKTWIPKGISNRKATDLIKRMIQFNEKDRPTLSQILEDAYFQPATKEVYPIYTYDKPGLCVIFNQELFTKLSHRAGTAQDWKRLRFVFEKLGFQVVIHHNLMSFDIRGEMKKLANEDFSKYGCLVVCLLSHGIENAIAGADGLYVNVNKLKYKFSYNNCPSLYGKPKIFIVQACQGVLEQNERNIVPLTLLSPDKSTGESKESTVQLSTSSAAIKYMTNCFHSLNYKDGAPNRNPPIMDFITIKSTIPGFVSMRNAQTGTYFIQALCQKMEEEYLINTKASSEMNGENKCDLEEILRGENGVQSIMNNKIQNREYRQTVSWETYLGKYVVFRSCSNQDILPYRDETDVDDGSNAHCLAEKYNFFVSPTDDHHEVRSIIERPRSPTHLILSQTEK